MKEFIQAISGIIVGLIVIAMTAEALSNPDNIGIAWTFGGAILVLALSSIPEKYL